MTVNYTPIHIWLDDYIPFNELFVIPYYLWFAYMVVVVGYFFFTSKSDFYKCTAFLFTGMTICLLIYTIWPNGQNLRPVSFARDNVLVDIVKNLYRTDTPTNVCPSIHVFNSIAAHIAVCRCKRLKEHKWLKAASFLLMLSICLSTVFLKQHSVFDGLCAMLLAAVMYLIVYVPDYSKLKEKIRSKKYRTEKETI